MARGKGNARRQAEEQARARRNSAAHRSLRRRAQKGTGARALQSPTGTDEAPIEAPDGTLTSDAPAEELVETDGGAEVEAERVDGPAAAEPTADEPHADVQVEEEVSPADEAHPADEEQPADEAETDPDPAVDADGDPDASEPAPKNDRPAPAWLAAGAVATAEFSDEAYVPRELPEPISDADDESEEGEGASQKVESDEPGDGDATEVRDQTEPADLDDSPHAAGSDDVAEATEPGDVSDPAEPVDEAGADPVVAPVWLEEQAAPADPTEPDPVAEADDAESTGDAEFTDDSETIGASEPGEESQAESASAAEDEPQVGDGVGAPARSSVFNPPAGDAEEPSVVEADDDRTAVHEPVGDTAVLAPVADTGFGAPDAPVTGSHDSGATTAAPWEESSGAAPTADDEGGDGDEPSRPKRRAAWAVPLGIAVVAVLYLGAQALLSNTVPRGTEMLGQQIGGMSGAEATGAVADAASDLEGADLELRVAEQTFMLPAADAGLSIDPERTVEQVTGFTVMPDRLWAHLAGGPDLTPVIGVDEQALEDAVESASVQLDGPSQDAGVTVADGAVEVVPGRSSVTVDQAASADRIVQAWPGVQAIELVAESEPPAITDEDAAAFASDLENETFAAPVTLVGDDAEATIEPETIASTSTVEPGPSGLSLVVDGQALAEQIIEDNPDLTTSGENASVSFDDDHQIVIDEGSPGITIDGEALGDAIIDAAGAVDRIGELPYTAADPEVSAEDLGLADFQEVISSFDTPLTADRVRTQNLRVAAADVQGVIVQPGETFDLTEALSPINEAEGYQPSGVIVNGILTSGMGGGLSQMATTAYNVGYFAGYEILDHRPHSVWFTRYPAGRESTIYTGSINVEFRNNTPYAAVFNSYLSGGSLHVDLWSTEHFEVTTSASPKTNVRQPGVKEVTAANCKAKSAGQPGFTITNTRTVYLEGDEVDRSSDTWTYKPDDAIRCVSEDDEDEDEDD